MLIAILEAGDTRALQYLARTVATILPFNYPASAPYILQIEIEIFVVSNADKIRDTFRAQCKF
jgi:hypothetical protein